VRGKRGRRDLEVGSSGFSWGIGVFQEVVVGVTDGRRLWMFDCVIGEFRG